LRIGIPSESFLSFVDEEVRLSWRRSLTELSSLGIDFVEVALSELSNLAVVADAITKCEAAAVHDRWIRSHFDEYSMFVRSRLEAGFHIPAARYLQAIASRGAVLERFMIGIFGAVDAIHLPVTPVKVPAIATTDIESPGQVPEVIAKITALTRPFNYLGLPAISVPSGFDAEGLPSGFQLVGRPFAEARLLNVAHLYQQAFGWHRRVPQLVGREATPRTHEVGSGK
jgi:aspartyl-tRNA(Asn)/glutamyl-tRNA(Gln) amidotransferase subunit A